MARPTEKIGWGAVEEAAQTAYSISFDGCHKIYMAMDKEQEAWFVKHYKTTVHGSPEEMVAQIKEWYEESCGLKFVSTVRTNHADPNAGYASPIPQGYDPDEEEWV